MAYSYPVQDSSLRPSSYVTHPSLAIRDTNDAQIILEAVRRNILPLIKRRLSEVERRRLVSGNVYVWEENRGAGGLQRWTEGRKWSQSKLRGDHLFYEEKVEVSQPEKEARRRANSKDTRINQNDRPSKPNGLLKQTYSVYVNTPGSQSAVKLWHLVAYFTTDDSKTLPVIDDYPYLQKVVVPPGVFTSRRHANGMNSNASDGEIEESGDTSTSTSAQNVVPYLPPMYHHGGSSGTRGVVLPPISTLPCHGGLPSRTPSSSSSSYMPLSPEDRRVLDSFRVNF